MSCCAGGQLLIAETNCAILWIILLPILGALLCAFLGPRWPKASGWIATSAVALSFAVAAPIAWRALHDFPSTVTAWQFLRSENLSVTVSFAVDALSGVMLFVVLGVGALIHLFSIEYMARDKSLSRYFAYLNMFIAFMLILILGDNLFMLFVGWEGVGLASYCLIGFWYEKDAPPRAGMKAFIVNRIGDLGFLMGLLLLAYHTGSANFSDIVRSAPDLAASTVTLFGRDVALTTIIAALLFLGACGKSAQFPLHVWLPDAMEGPTPVSALIHAATMVTAGVYMTARMDVIFAEALFVREIMLIVALITSLGAAFAALAQTDLKRILAYSTISQLGYMMAGIAAGSKQAAVFHLATHAVFKALLFLSAGSVMHALSGELDIRKMGGLFKRIPATSTMLIVGALGLAGCPGLAGYFSKDLIIVEVAEHHPIAAALLILGALVTAFYSARMVMVALFGNDRIDHHTADHCHESGMIVLIPLGLLAGLTFIVGWPLIGIPHLLGMEHEPRIAWAAYGATAAALGGMIAGGWYYRSRIPSADPERVILDAGSALKHPCSADSPLARFARSGFGMDALYKKTVIDPVMALAKWSRDVVDRVFIDSIAEGLANMTMAIGESMRTFQTGNLGTYLCYMAAGLAVLLWVVK